MQIDDLRYREVQEVNSSNDITVRPVVEGDRADWNSLYHAYRDFYKLAYDEDVVSRVWGWVSTGANGIHGLVAVDAAGKLTGLADLRVFARPSSGSIGVYLDDLFTSPDHRGRGIGTALLQEARRYAGSIDATVVRWITSEDNKTARSVYDANATLTKWVTYDMVPEQPQGE